MISFKRLIQILAAICENAEMIFLSLMTIMVFSQVVSRYLFSYSFAWVEALTRYLMIWMAYLGAAVLFKEHDHISMDLVYKKLPRKLRSIFMLLFGLLQIAFLVMLFRKGLQYAASVNIIISPTLGISMRWPTLIISISAVLMIIFIVFDMVQTITGLIGPKVQMTDLYKKGH